MNKKITIPTVESMLSERGQKYGSFAIQAATAQEFKAIIASSPNWHTKLDYCQRESLHLIATKISRILNGDPNHIDSWKDIAGYAMLVANQLEEEAKTGIQL